jgi:hypothetical protein
LARNCPKLFKIETLGDFNEKPTLLVKKKNGLFQFVMSQNYMDRLDNDSLASCSEEDVSDSEDE